jgi:hypothetical protein
VVLVLPGIVAGALLVVVNRQFKSPLGLPAAMLLIPVAFYVMLSLLGSSLDDARQAGWLGQSNAPASYSVRGAWLGLVCRGICVGAMLV